jgi:hypothetical protein
VWLAKALVRPATRKEAVIKIKAYSTGVGSALSGKVYSEKV